MSCLRTIHLVGSPFIETATTSGLVGSIDPVLTMLFEALINNGSFGRITKYIISEKALIPK